MSRHKRKPYEQSLESNTKNSLDIVLPIFYRENDIPLTDTLKIKVNGNNNYTTAHDLIDLKKFMVYQIALERVACISKTI